MRQSRFGWVGIVFGLALVALLFLRFCHLQEQRAAQGTGSFRDEPAGQAQPAPRTGAARGTTP